MEPYEDDLATTQRSCEAEEGGSFTIIGSMIELDFDVVVEFNRVLKLKLDA